MEQRIIKFRCWDKTEKKMCEVALLRYSYIFGKEVRIGLFRDKEKDAFYQVGLKRSKLMQFTGLLDKNGKEIFESDLVKVLKFPDVKVDFKGEVVFEKGAFLVKENDNTFYDLGDCIYASRGCKIIGNIYEGVLPKYKNTELIKD